MASNILRPVYVASNFTHNTHVYQNFNMVDKNTSGLNNCNFGTRSGLKKKTTGSSNSKSKSNSKFKFNTSRVEKAFCFTSIFNEGIPC